MVAEGLEDAARQAVPQLRRLVGVAGGTDRDALAPPARPPQLAPQHLDQIGFDDDALVEVAAGVVAQVLVVAPSEAVDAGVLAAAVGVEAPAHLGHGGHVDAVERALAPDLFEGDLWHDDPPFVQEYMC